ncbi:glyoxalase [Actinophytocola xinjiangensis]|uniref:Glyoxalase n=1 Tax=Actinophytocola xinjiangensis TaxID=485602 RepID=A0A7Z0WMK5_9PSEU|nr:VOC family protein [Actinophytocola xinjiangensis]OLF08492.1 glyoxalase [Actinophytocola xinjiangensis]
MNLNLGGVTIDCADPRTLAGFWTRALGLEVAFDAEGEYIQLGGGDGRPMVALQRVAESKTVKNRVHLDLATDDREGEVARLVGLGASRGADHAVPGLEWTVLTDPEGNEFCVGSPH